MPENAMPCHPQSLVLRNAKKEDLDSIVDVVWAGFAEEPEVNYRFPRRREYPNDYSKWTRSEYAEYIQQPEKYAFHVVDGPVQMGDDVARKPIALAVWDIAVLTKSKSRGIGVGERRDANQKHCDAYAHSAQQRHEKYLSKYGGDQIYLSILMTHPDHRRRGAGTMLVDWGFKYAREKQWPVTVAASPMGRLLYAHLGFEEIGTEVIRVEGEEEKLEHTIMACPKQD